MLGVTAERFPKGGALLLGLMGCFGNLAIWQALPQMGAIYDSYTVASLPSDVRTQYVTGPGGDAFPLVKEGEASWLPRVVTERIFPAGSQKLNPQAAKLLEDKAFLASHPNAQPLRDAVTHAEAVGAAYAYRWVAVLPCLLVFIFGAIALTDWLRGGYRQVHLEGTLEKEATPL
jgi:hypothetical protein